VKTFMAELYVSRAARVEVGRRSDALRAAAEQLTAEGKRITYLRTLFTPEDETCFHVLRGQREDDVAEACRRAGIPYERISEVVDPDADMETGGQPRKEHT
jgi:hypothetical protein